ncbi:NUDIX domain-containing protein [Synechococcales cyanobacterium C]|uniref:NUDIX domain-containing protein n=1 Tax=Petrachloros mirabilis ULC683 TaxID=2781853 RepID=A0A8K1ZWY8_9CYAN|nr:NUDIX domain-containing protein [Petrachloros mirabilis ULC683]
MSRLQRLFQVALGVVFRHPVLGISLIALQEDGQIVMVRRQDNQKWSLPGGLVDWGESLPSTIQRELKEETGLEVAQIGRLVGVYSSPTRDPRMHSICLAIEVKVTGEMGVIDTLEILEVKSFLPEQIDQESLAHDHSQHLQDYWQGLTTIA